MGISAGSESPRRQLAAVLLLGGCSLGNLQQRLVGWKCHCSLPAPRRWHQDLQHSSFLLCITGSECNFPGFSSTYFLGKQYSGRSFFLFIKSHLTPLFLNDIVNTLVLLEHLPVHNLSLNSSTGYWLFSSLCSLDGHLNRNWGGAIWCLYTCHPLGWSSHRFWMLSVTLMHISN